MSGEKPDPDLPSLEDLSLPTLEAPGSADLSPAGQGAVLLDGASVALNATKLVVAETLLALVIKDLSYPDFMREILLMFLKTIKCEAGSIFEVEPAGKFLFFRAAAGQQSDRLSALQIPIGRGIVGYAHESRQIACVQDCKHDPRFLKAVDQTVGFNTRNLIAIPIVIRDRVFCVVEVLNRIGADQFSDEDIELVKYIADLVGKGLEARLMMNWALAQAKNQTAKDVA
ncbi:MAG: GAF domain-containing protein [Oligoflexia bacterium]